MENAILLARLQFAVTTVYHFFFVPLTLGLSVLLALLQTLWLRTGNLEYRALTRFWGRLFLINFGIGVVTGIVQEFQFGMNWSGYSVFVGDVFGAPLAIEALLAFFLESTFLGLWIFGEGRLSPKLHTACLWLVAIGSNISAVWILIANSFMQHPVGFVLRNGRAEMQNFLTLITNPHVMLQYPHVFFGGLTTAGFFMLGISAWHLLRHADSAHSGLFLRSFRMGAVAGLVGALGAAGSGHAQAQELARIQPMKLAAAEGLYENADPAGLSLFALIDEKGHKTDFDLRLPGALSFLVHNRLSGEVKGLIPLQQEAESQYGPGNYIPPVTLTYWSFRTMVGSGFALIGLAAFATLFPLILRRSIPRLLLLILPLSMLLPYLANSTGWLVAELGRQPWVVYGLMLLRDGLSPSVSPGEVAISLVVFTLLYATLILTTLKLFWHHSRVGITQADISGAPASH